MPLDGLHGPPAELSLAASRGDGGLQTPQKSACYFEGRALNVEPNEAEVPISKPADEWRPCARRRLHRFWSDLCPGAADGISDADSENKFGQSRIALGKTFRDGDAGGSIG